MIRKSYILRRLTRRRRRARKKAMITTKAADWKRSKELDKEAKIQLKEAHETYLKDIFMSETHPLEPVPDVPYSLPSMPDINTEEN